MKQNNLHAKLGVVIILLVLTVGNTFAQSSLKVMTFNVRYDEALFNKGEPKPSDWVNRKILQLELIKKNRPDVIGMQEPHLHQVQYLAENLESYSWYGVGRDDGKEKNEFNPIFYRNDKLSLVKSGTFWLSNTPEMASKSWDAGYYRICTWVLFECKKGKNQFYVFNTHFDSKGKNARLESAKLINKKIKEIGKDKPVFVLGDFNFQPQSVPFKEIISGSLSDSKKRVENAPMGPEGTINGFRYGATHKRRIDFIFTNDKVDVEEYRVIDYSKEGIYPSDHFPVMVQTKR